MVVVVVVVFIVGAFETRAPGCLYGSTRPVHVCTNILSLVVIPFVFLGCMDSKVLTARGPFVFFVPSAQAVMGFGPASVAPRPSFFQTGNFCTSKYHICDNDVPGGAAFGWN